MLYKQTTLSLHRQDKVGITILFRQRIAPCGFARSAGTDLVTSGRNLGSVTPEETGFRRVTGLRQVIYLQNRIERKTSPLSRDPASALGALGIAVAIVGVIAGT